MMPPPFSSWQPAIIPDPRKEGYTMTPNDHPAPGLPTLDSIASYAKLCPGSSDDAQEHYRMLLKMAADPSPWYSARLIPWADGGRRMIHIPSQQLHRQQKFLLQTILCKLPASDHAFAYRKGYSISDCTKLDDGHAFLLHLELADLFGSTTENMVYTMFCRETGYPPLLCRFFSRLCCLWGRLPQVAITSPVISNIVLRPCDEALHTLAAEHGMDYRRYAKDLFFSGSADIDIPWLLVQISKILYRFDFRTNLLTAKVLRQPQGVWETPTIPKSSPGNTHAFLLDIPFDPEVLDVLGP
jgi:hypothetical protein